MIWTAFLDIKIKHCIKYEFSIKGLLLNPKYRDLSNALIIYSKFNVHVQHTYIVLTNRSYTVIKIIVIYNTIISEALQEYSMIVYDYNVHNYTIKILYYLL